MVGCSDLYSFLEMRPEGTSVLTLLETDGRRIKAGDEVQGSLSASDYVDVGGSYLEAWAFRGKQGDRVTIDLISDDFDSYLYVVGPGLSETLRDDDGGGACHARVELNVLERGVFYVVASTSGSGRTGTYRLRVSDEPTPRAAMSCGGIEGQRLTALSTEGRELERETPNFGRLTGGEPSIDNDRPVQAWALRGRAGERVTIRLESDDFDAYLYAFGPGMSEVMTNDDGAGGLDSELTFTFSESATYIVGAAALSSGSMGSYTLSVSEPLDMATMGTANRRLRMDDEVQGLLSEGDPEVEGKPVQAWLLEARAGDRVTVDLISDDFDSYLYIAGPGLREPLSNDDGGEGLHSQISVTFPESGAYRVVASSLGGSTGAYTLRVR